MTLRLLTLLCLLWHVLATNAFSQITATLQFPRETYLVDEQITGTLSITNMSGRELVLKPGLTDGIWCSVQVTAVRGQAPTYKPDAPIFPPLTVAAGETVTRRVPLHELFELPGTGQYRARVAISFGATRSEYVTQATYFTTDPGHKLWSATVGVPEGQPEAGTPRTFSVVSLRRRDGIFLYARLDNQQNGLHFPPYLLGRMLMATPPQIQLDRDNNLYVLHATADDAYLLSQIDVATGKSGQAAYRAKNPKTGRPGLQRIADGRLVIAGGIRITEEETAAAKSARPPLERARISDRPPSLAP